MDDDEQISKDQVQKSDSHEVLNESTRMMKPTEGHKRSEHDTKDVHDDFEGDR